MGRNSREGARQYESRGGGPLGAREGGAGERRCTAEEAVSRIQGLWMASHGADSSFLSLSTLLGVFSSCQED